MTDTATVSAPATAPKSRLDMLREGFAKAGFLVFMPGQQSAELEALAAEMEVTDWTTKAPETFTGLIVAKTKGENAETRIVAFPDKETALADPLVRDTLYNRFVKMVLKAARNPEAAEDQFTKPAGILGEAFDLDAFRFQSKKWVKALRELGLSKIGPRSLKQALENSDFASSIFPAFKDWAKLIGLMAAHAEKSGYSPALFGHWAATRDRKSYEMKPVSLGDLDALLAKIEASDEDVDEDDTDGE